MAKLVMWLVLLLLGLLVGATGGEAASWAGGSGAAVRFPQLYVSSWEAPYGPPMVVVAHDREPGRQSREHGDKDVTTPDNECNENHHLQPDGDADCDDPPVKGVPEPGPLVLLATGILALLWRRRD